MTISASRFELSFWRQVEQAQQKVVSVDLARLEHRRGERSAIPSDQEWLELPGGESLDFRVTFPLPNLEPGEYLLDLAYVGMPEEDLDPSRISGEYHADIAAVEVEEPSP